LEAELARLKEQLAAYTPGMTPPADILMNYRRGELKPRIIALLQQAGSEGLTVKKLATELRIKPGNLHGWFGSTARRTAGIVKVGPARYCWLTDVSL